MDAAWDRFFTAEFASDEFVIIEGFLIRKVEPAGLRFLGPAGLFVRPALGAGAGAARNICAAIGADFRLWLDETAVMAAQIRAEAMMRQRHIAARTFGDIAAIATENEGRLPAPINE